MSIPDPTLEQARAVAVAVVLGLGDRQEGSSFLSCPARVASKKTGVGVDRRRVVEGPTSISAARRVRVVRYDGGTIVSHPYASSTQEGRLCRVLDTMNYEENNK